MLYVPMWFKKDKKQKTNDQTGSHDYLPKTIALNQVTHSFMSSAISRSYLC